VSEGIEVDNVWEQVGAIYDLSDEKELVTNYETAKSKEGHFEFIGGTLIDPTKECFNNLC
jgi:hypothetical protein